MTERKPFERLSLADNPQFQEDGVALYKALKEKYPHPTVLNLDNILNALVYALTTLAINSVAQDNRMNFLQLIYTILKENIEKNSHIA